MLISTSAIENLANESKDIDCSDYDTGAGNNRPRTVEDIHMLECTVEDGHFGNETAESRKSEVSKSGNYIADSQERHNLHQTGELAYVTGMSAAVYHTDKGKEQGSHQSVAEHLQDSTGTSCLVHHQDGEEYETAVRYGRICVDILQVRLYTSRESTVNYGNTSQDKEDPAKFLGSFGHQIHGDTEATITSKFHQYTCMEHTYSRRRRGMTVRAPCMERE